MHELRKPSAPVWLRGPWRPRPFLAPSYWGCNCGLELCGISSPAQSGFRAVGKKPDSRPGSPSWLWHAVCDPRQGPYPP